MKKSILILCACAAFAGCSEDDLVVKKPAVPGSEVQFGATAYMSNGNSTRTAYGDADAVNKEIELRWVKDDKIDIACPQAAAGRRKAAYQIVTESIVEDPNSSTIDNGKATQLEKLGEYGIQWGKPGNHDFYALYPSSKSFTDSERGNIGMDGDGVNGYLPVNQNPIEVKPDGSNYILKPDMCYAFMVAQNSVNSANEGFNGVSLSFEPLVTALQFELFGAEIKEVNTGKPTDIQVTSVSLLSDNINICGNFQYKFADRKIIDKNGETGGYERITMSFDPITLTSSQSMNFTFFLLPVKNIEAKKLRLQVFYTYNGSPFTKTLVIGKNLNAKWKYFFKNVKIPGFSNDISGSKWFSALAPDVLISQLSIPVAGNAFSSYYDKENPEYYKEQTLNYIELWNKGVRGFEFSTAHGKTGYDNTKTGTLEDNRFVCNGQAMQVTNDAGTPVTFGNAFRALATELAKNPNECLIIICNYKTYASSGNDCQQYVKDLEAWLTTNDTINKKLVKLTPSSTVGDLRGKIAIIVRPGEDAYSSKATSEITVTNANLTLVQDWGTCIDKWNRRFGSTYAIEGAFAKTGETKIEDYLWGVSENNSNQLTLGSYGKAFVEGYPTTDNPANHKYDHKTETSGQTVHVQEWARIIPENSFACSQFNSGVSDYHNVWGTGKTFYLFLKWPESYSQKQAMIKETVAASMATMGGSTENKLFINSLCGYYPVSTLPVSYYPYNTEYSYHIDWGAGRTNTFKLNNAGAGGDFVTCAYDLNKWLYEYLTKYNTDGENGPLKQGPVGLVMLNHIGNTTDHADDKSLDLVNWIMMNNFRFPLATDSSAQSDSNGPGQGENSDDSDMLLLND